MAENPPPLPSTPPAAQAEQWEAPGERIDDGKGRIFPCPSCGADLEFNIGVQKLKCPYCSHVVDLTFDGSREIAEQDLEAALARQAERRQQGVSDQTQSSEVRCESCGANVLFTDTLTSSECPYCGSPIQREKIHDATDRIPVDGVLPFLIDRDIADGNLKGWVKSRWFAPNDFRKRGANGKFNGVYLPYWTFDALTLNRYHGQRGEHYYVTVGTGKDRRTERRTRWWPASGSFQRFFDDVLALAATGLPLQAMEELEPWELRRSVPFNQELLAGFFAQTYEVPLENGFQVAREKIARAIYADVCRRIGGDEQRVSSIDTRHKAVTYKHILLPVWLLAYRYHDKSYRVAVNASTGEVQGERPYSWIKITLAVLAAAAVIITFVTLSNSSA